MGLSLSKRVNGTLANSDVFASACQETYSHCLSLAQHAAEGVFPYQLATASDHLYHILSSVRPHQLVLRWLPEPPSRSQVDSAYRLVKAKVGGESVTLAQNEFRLWAVELFTDAVVSSAGKAVLLRVPIGVAGIAGIGALTRSGKELIGTVVAVYSLGVVGSVFHNLSV